MVKVIETVNGNLWIVRLGLECGFRIDIAELLHCSDFFVFPSLQKGLLFARMETMANGLPCVASKIKKKLIDIYNLT